MTGDTIGLKIATVSASAKMIAIIRKYSNNPMGKIKRSVQERNYVLLYPYTDRLGLKKIIACYDELKENGIEATYLEEPYVPHPLAGVMAQNKPEAAKEKHVWSTGDQKIGGQK